jgi:transposase
MLTLPATTRLFFCTQPTDMRKSFDGLFGLVSAFLGHDPLSGHFFVFRNRCGDRLKVLYWDRDGLAIWYKRLEKGTFRFPAGDGPGARSVELDACQWALILQGIDLATARRLPRYSLPNPQPPNSATAQ